MLVTRNVNFWFIISTYVRFEVLIVPAKNGLLVRITKVTKGDVWATLGALTGTYEYSKIEKAALCFLRAGLINLKNARGYIFYIGCLF